MAPRRQASKSRSRSRGGRAARRTVKKTDRTKTGAFLNFVRSMRDLFPSHTPDRLKHDSKAIWKEMGAQDKSMYGTSSSRSSDCGPGRMGYRRRGRSRSRSRGRSRSRSRSRSSRRRRRRG